MLTQFMIRKSQLSHLTYKRETDLIYPACCKDQVRYPIETDMYQYKRVRITECGEEERR